MKSKFVQFLPFLIVAGITAALYLRPHSDAPSKAAKPKKQRAIPVTTVRVTRGDLRETYPTVGTAAGRTQVRIASPVDGVLVAVAVRIGERVKQGQSLATLDDRLLRAELARAEAALGRSSQELIRVRELVAKGVAEDRRLEGAAAQEQMDRAVVEQVQAQLAQSRFPSPFDGIVTEQHAYPGDTLRAGSPVMTLADVTRLRVFVKVPDSLVGRVKPGASATLQSDAAGPAELPATVAEIYPAADPVSHQTTIELDAGDVFPRLKPGFLVKVRLTLAEHKQALTLDRRVVPDARSDTTVKVVIVRGDQAEIREVQLGLVLEDSVEVIKGVDEGDVVVLRGGEKLRDGDPVQVVAHGAAPNGGRSN